MAAPPAQAFSTLARAARGDVWTPHVVRALNRLLSTDVLLADLRGSVLAAAPSRSSIDPMRVLAAATGQDESVTAVPVQVAGETVALLGCAAGRAVGELLDFAATMIGADLRAHLKVLRAKDEDAAAAIGEVIRATAPDPNMLDRLQSAGLVVDRPFRILVGGVQVGQERLATVAWNLHALLAEDSNVPSRMTIDGKLVTLVPDGAAVRQRAKRLWEQLRRLDPEAAVGVSQAHTEVIGLRMAHAEAVRAADLGPGVHQAEALDVVTTMLLSQTAPEAVAAAASYLAPLIAYDRMHGGQLIGTLRSWLDNDRSTPATAQALFIHRNTLRYRLKQAGELLGQSLEATTTIANLTLALRITLADAAVAIASDPDDARTR